MSAPNPSHTRRAIAAAIAAIAALCAPSAAGAATNGPIALLGSTEISTFRTDGSPVAQLALGDEPPLYLSEAAYSPDGTRLAVVAHAAFEFDALYVMGADGTGVTKLTDSPSTRISAPTWTEDGSKVVYIANPDSDAPAEIRAIAPEGGAETTIAANADRNSFSDQVTPVENPSLSIVGDRLAYSSTESEIVIVGTDGSNPVQLTHNDRFDGEPVLSPDGSKIAYTTGRRAGIVVANVDGSSRRRLTPRKVRAVTPLFTPDGARIAYTRNGDVATMNVDGTGRRVVAAGRRSQYVREVSPDGTRLAYAEILPVAGEDTVWRHRVVGIDGGRRTKLGRPGLVYGDWASHP